MGDLKAHAKVASAVMKIVAEIGPKDKQGKPLDNPQYIELGNFLTDLSQFRDPPSWVSAKPRIWDIAKKESAAWTLDVIANLDEYLIDMMGGPARLHGDLPTFMHHFSFIFGCERFRKAEPAISGENYEQIFRKFENDPEYKGYTQYWPHEHFDMPLYMDEQLVPNPSDIGPSKQPVHTCSDGEPPGGTRRVAKALELDIEYCAEILTLVEWQWRRLVRMADTPQNRNERAKILALYGHISHVVEDFFYHSNFIDLAWVRTELPLPAPEDKRDAYERLWKRRLRSPVGARNNTVLSAHDSTRSTHVISGSFGTEDVFFTLRDVLNGLPEGTWYQNLPAPAKDVLRPLFDPSERKEMRPQPDDPPEVKLRREEKFKKWWERKQAMTQQVASQPAPPSMPQGVPSAHMLSLREFKVMCDIDYRLCSKYTWVPEKIRGPFAFMLELIGQSDDAYADSMAKSENFNKVIAIVRRDNPEEYEYTLDRMILPTQNAAAGENIGSHSLLGKDNPRKNPLFDQAANVAQHVACYIARVLCYRAAPGDAAAARFSLETESSAVNTISSPPCIDWLHLLQHFCCHPDECENRWYIAAMEDPNVPAVHVIRFLDDSTRQQRMKLQRRGHLEALYKTLLQSAEAKWQKTLKA